jgi:UDP-2-acetamido-3-amino-2,3-dideoxy-glucuronate N-acetyltransferase
MTGIHPRAYVHPSAIIDPAASIGEGAKVWHFVHIMAGAHIGRGVVLGHACFVGAGVRVGDGSRIQNHVSLFEGVELEEDVFCGPSAVFTNVAHPRAHLRRRDAFCRTLVRRGATIGANATILPGMEIGRYAFVGAGATVTHDVSPHTLVVGVPARPSGLVSRRGCPLIVEGASAVCEESGERYDLVRGVPVLVEEGA